MQQICMPLFALHVGYPRGIAEVDQEIDLWLQSDLEPISWADFIWAGMLKYKCMTKGGQNLQI
jgi:hypothetical protein